MEELGRGEFSILRFYERRARRILPALFAILLLCLPFAWLWLLPEQLKGFTDSLGAVLVFLSNIYFMSQVSYFAPDAELQPLLHTWSLAVEEQYYLLFPLILLLSHRFGRGTLIAVTLGLAIGSLALNAFGNSLNAERNFFFSPSRFWELGAGSLCALLLPPHRRLRNGTLALTGLGLILGSVLLYDDQLASAVPFTMFPVAGTVLVVLFCREDTLAGRMLSHSAPVGIGLVSYSAYLVHQPLFAFARIRSPEEPSALMMGALCLVTLALAWLIWRFIEQPFRGTRPRVLGNRGRFTWTFASVAAGLMAVAVAISVQDGVPGRVEARYAGDIGSNAFFDTVRQRFEVCDNGRIRDAASRHEGQARCFQSHAGRPVTVALIGDSHAEHLFPGLAEALPDEVVASYLQNTVPLLGDPQMAVIFDELSRMESLEVVVFAMHWPRRYVQYDDPAGFEAGLKATLTYLQGLGVKVFVVGDLPWFASEPASCKYEIFPGSVKYCTTERIDARAANSIYGPMLERLSAETGVPIVPARQIFCEGGQCSMVRDGGMQFRDSNHLSIAGSERLGRIVADLVRDALS